MSLLEQTTIPAGFKATALAADERASLYLVSTLVETGRFVAPDESLGFAVFSDFADQVARTIVSESVSVSLTDEMSAALLAEGVKSIEEIRLLDSVRARAYDTINRGGAGLYMAVQTEMHDRDSVEYTSPVVSPFESGEQKAFIFDPSKPDKQKWHWVS